MTGSLVGAEADPLHAEDRPGPRQGPDARTDGSIGRVFDIFDLFSTDLPLIRVEDVMERLGYTKSTAYRYLKGLCDVGFVANAGGGLYSLGPRIVELERLMCLTDPLLRVGHVEMPALLASNPNSVVLLSSLYGDRVLCVHKVGPEVITADHQKIRLLRSRGFPLPLFYGAASLAILAFQPAHRVRSLYLNHQSEISEARLASDWKTYRSKLTAIRRDGHVVTIGQFNPLLAAVAVPLPPRGEGEVRASLTRILAREDLPQEGPGGLIEELKACAAQIGAQ
ncbi:IclR family transcriptional regulator [Humitalea sp. 24SJ18S-53]|uniref:IclR family transcriptional regulator n=1 Tax=Humitalea sp. 24SJ18S-53 TaxID=3422307 RepID=UPI003D67419C